MIQNTNSLAHAIAGGLLVAWLAASGAAQQSSSSKLAEADIAREVVLGKTETYFQQVTDPQQRRDLKLNPAASCAATACHGGPRAGVVSTGASRGAEYPLWLESDPHARSWQTLCSPKSVAILQRLNTLKDDHITDQAAFDNCLACHNSSRHADEPRIAQRLQEGVGCSSCHGPDQLWRSNHYQQPHASRQLSKSLDGMANTKDLLVRARLCASCHVGDADRDMNHDVIAAGHPALHYEFATYHRRLPKHWRSDPTGWSQDESTLWLVGQIASLDAFLTLLEARASQATSVSQWPELAVFDCSSCHQSLTVADYSAAKKVTAAPAFSQWYSFGTEQLMSWLMEHSHSGPQPGQLEAERLLSSLAKLATITKSPQVEPGLALAAASETRSALDGWLRSTAGQQVIGQFNRDQLHAMLSTAGMDSSSSRSWEAAAQFYLASVASRSRWSAESVEQDSVLESARQLRRALQFGKDKNTPQNRFGSSGAGQLSVQAHWQALRNTLVNP